VKAHLIPLLRKVFLASLPAPFALGSAACGGQVATSGDASFDAEVGDDVAAEACSTPPLDAGATPPADGACLAYTLPVDGTAASCGVNGAPAGPDECDPLCHQHVTCCAFIDPGAITCSVGNCLCLGRRPRGVTLQPAGGRGGVGRWFAELAALEQASVTAFEVLADELSAHRAPSRLIAAAKLAAHDETRHARIMSAFATRYGGRPSTPRIQRGAVRPLAEVAIENAVEGCVRETYGVLIGMWQATFAGDPRIRRVMSRIARDESRHAALSWQVARWIEAQLTPDERGRLDTAKAAAIRQLEADVSVEPDAAVVRQAGIPTASAARRLFEHAHASLWSRPS
jgi:hypothetical protein